MTDTQASDAPPVTGSVLTITQPALDKVLEIRAGEDEAESLALHIEVTGVAGVEYAYELTFEPVSETGPDTTTEDHSGLPVVIPDDSVPKLTGATLDLPQNPMQEGLVLRNPNRPSLFGDDDGDLELEGTVEERITALLNRSINPAIASHGGLAELVRVEGDVAHVRMSGGCQGCGMAAATLRNGIEVAIVDAIPEIERVVDATDHAAGENPYYTPTG